MYLLTFGTLFLIGLPHITKCKEAHFCKVDENNIAKISEWSKFFIKSQDEKRMKAILEKSEINEQSKMEMLDKYYESAAKPLQGGCNILKRIAGTWGETASK